MTIAWQKRKVSRLHRSSLTSFVFLNTFPFCTVTECKYNPVAIHCYVFINSVYIYEEKIIITFNYKDGEKTLIFQT